MIPLGVVGGAHYVAPPPDLSLVYSGEAASTGAGSKTTYTDVPIGPPSAGRTLVIGVGLQIRAVASILVGGVVATIVANARGSSPGSTQMAFAQVPYPTGSSADIDITYSHYGAAGLRSSLFVCSSPAPLVLADSAGRSFYAPQDGVVTINPGGPAVVVAMSGNTQTTTTHVSWNLPVVYGSTPIVTLATGTATEETHVEAIPDVYQSVAAALLAVAYRSA